MSAKSIYSLLKTSVNKEKIFADIENQHNEGELVEIFNIAYENQDCETMNVLKEYIHDEIIEEMMNSAVHDDNLVMCKYFIKEFKYCTLEISEVIKRGSVKILEYLMKTRPDKVIREILIGGAGLSPSIEALFKRAFEKL